MIKLNGAVLYNVMGIVTLVTYYDRLKDLTLSNEKINDWLMIAKGLSSLVVSILYYVEVFQTWGFKQLFISFMVVYIS